MLSGLHAFIHLSFYMFIFARYSYFLWFGMQLVPWNKLPLTRSHSFFNARTQSRIKANTMSELAALLLEFYWLRARTSPRDRELHEQRDGEPSSPACFFFPHLPTPATCIQAQRKLNQCSAPRNYLDSFGLQDPEIIFFTLASSHFHPGGKR